MLNALLGAIGFGSALIGLFFLRFWRRTRDRLFLFFALTFFLEALNRIALVGAPTSESNPAIYLVRLLEYGLIIVAIWQKNRKR